MSVPNRRLLFAALSALLSTLSLMFGQAVSGTINGYVSDTAEAFIPGAKVTITNTGTGAVTSRTTDEAGLYVATNLPPGTYSVAVEAPGFRRTVQENVELRIDSAVRVDLRLELGAVTEQVTVSGAAPILKTEKTDVGQYIPEQQLRELPTFGRNLSKLYNTIPGVIQNSFQIGAGENPSEFNGTVVHGQFFGNSEYDIDGVTNTACCFSGFQVIVPNQDSVQEMKLTTAAYDPEYGASAGMVAQYVTKSGSNRFHGSLFEFNRNKATFAADPFTEKLPNTGKDGKGFGYLRSTGISSEAAPAGRSGAIRCSFSVISRALAHGRAVKGPPPYRTMHSAMAISAHCQSRFSTR